MAACARCELSTITLARPRSLPPDNPADAIDWNEKKRRDTGMGISDLKGWFLELARLDNPVRREFHLFTLLSGSRPAALQEIRPDRIDFQRRTLHISKPKGGKKRAFDIPLSRQMVLCLIRAISLRQGDASSRSASMGVPS
jgi:integrase